MKFIQLTLLAEIEVLINVEMIGHMYPQAEMIKGKEKGYTQICLVTNNNGGMKVKESIYEILELIKN
jgi:hypothetical protein